VVLLSGGIDSAATLAFAKAKHADRMIALTVDYGQRHSREIQAAQELVAAMGGDLDLTPDGEHVHLIVDMDAFGMLAEHSALTTTDFDVPAETPERMTVPITYVPHRNAMLLTCAAAALESFILNALEGGEEVSGGIIYYGAHRDDWGGYPDCTPGFVNAMSLALNAGSKISDEHNIPIEVQAPFLTQTKAQVVQYALAFNVPLHLTWSCYNGGVEPCGSCATCTSRNEALHLAAHAANVEDPDL